MTGLLTPDEVVARLRRSRKTLQGHVRNGDIRYVAIGRGTKRQRRMFTDADVEEFIERQTHRNTLAPPTSTARRSKVSPSNPEVMS